MLRLLAAVALVACAASAAGCARSSDDDGGDDSRPPVVVLILDEFPTDDLLGPDGRIDTERFPNFARLAGMSTWFPGAHTVFDSTFSAVPAILDARLPAPRTAPDVRSHQPSVYHLMDGLGYEIHQAESATAVCPPRICSGARTRRPGVIAQLKGATRPARLHHWIDGIRPRARPGFYLHHTLLPHEPWLYLPSGHPDRPSGEDPITGMNLPPGFADPWLSRHNHMRHLLQVGYVDHELGRLLDRLEETGMLDEALLVVVADHGYSFDIGAESRRKVTEANVDEVGPVPFFVKAPGQTDGEVDQSLVRNLDVVPTIADLLGARLRWPHDGRSVLGSEEREQVVIQTRDFGQEIRVGRAELEQRRAANRRRWAQLFGTGVQSRLLYGDPWASVYRMGPNSGLIGRRPPVESGTGVVRVGTAGGGSAQAEVANAGLLRDLDPGAPIHPTRITGRLARAPGAGVRELAVAVNGRVRAVGMSFRLGRSAEFFSFVVPETALRGGANRVELFEVRGAGRELVSLGGVGLAQGAAR